MWARIVKVLSIGDFHGHDSIALGAWGGDAFGNDANKIAALFERALQNNFQDAYRRVIFAIGTAMSDWNEAPVLSAAKQSRRKAVEPFGGTQGRRLERLELWIVLTVASRLTPIAPKAGACISARSPQRIRS
jgi:hypothetical protein